MSPAPSLVGEFLARVVDVLREAAGVDAAFAAAPTGGGTPGQIAVLISARGDLSGMTWWFPAEVARRVALRMIPGIDPDPSICEAAAAELANVLTGRGLVFLAERGYHIEIDPPAISTVHAAGVGGMIGTEIGAIEVIFHLRTRAPRKIA